MIHKFLIVSKQLMMSSTKVENEQNTLYNIDLMLPLGVYWQISDLLAKADYLVSSDEHAADVHELYKKVFRQTAPYAVFENDRVWLYQHASQSGTGVGSSGSGTASA